MVARKKITKKSTKTNKNGLTLPVYNHAGELQKPYEVDGLEQTAKKKVLNQAVWVYLANQKGKTAHTKTRGEVRGGGKKPWRQKGTGRARQGSIRAPHWRGGGIVFGPRAHMSSFKLLKKMKRGALSLALIETFKNIKVLALDKELKKTKEFNELFKKIFDLQKVKKIVFVLDKESKNMKTLRNLNYVNVVRVNSLSAFDLLNAQEVVFENKALENFLAGLKK